MQSNSTRAGEKEVELRPSSPDNEGGALSVAVVVVAAADLEQHLSSDVSVRDAGAVAISTDHGRGARTLCSRDGDPSSSLSPCCCADPDTLPLSSSLRDGSFSRFRC